MASIKAYFRSVETLNLAPPRATNRLTTSGFKPVPPWTIQRRDDPLAVDDLLDLLEAVEVDLGVLGRVDAVGRADRGSEQIHAAPLDKLQRPGRVAQLGLGLRNPHLILHARDSPQFALDGDVAPPMAVLDHLTRDADVLVEVQLASRRT